MERGLSQGLLQAWPALRGPGVSAELEASRPPPTGLLTCFRRGQFSWGWLVPWGWQAS